MKLKTKVPEWVKVPTECEKVKYMTQEEFDKEFPHWKRPMDNKGRFLSRFSNCPTQGPTITVFGNLLEYNPQ